MTIGSYENDRALAAACTADDIDGDLPQSFDSVKDAMKWAKEKNVEIVDEYHGCIY